MSPIAHLVTREALSRARVERRSQGIQTPTIALVSRGILEGVSRRRLEIYSLLLATFPYQTFRIYSLFQQTFNSPSLCYIYFSYFAIWALAYTEPV